MNARRYTLCSCGNRKCRSARVCARCRHASQIVRRYPYEPLGALLGGGRHEQAIRLGAPVTTIAVLIRRGLSPLQADRYAVRAGHHPSLVWPSWFDDALEDERGAA